MHTTKPPPEEMHTLAEGVKTSLNFQEQRIKENADATQQGYQMK